MAICQRMEWLHGRHPARSAAFGDRLGVLLPFAKIIWQLTSSTWLESGSLYGLQSTSPERLRDSWVTCLASCRWQFDESPEEASQLVGRDVERLDLAGCNRATLKALAKICLMEWFPPLIWLTLVGIPGMLAFKVISTMDSMVGYRNSRYLRFGWFGARADDLMNWLPARLTWVLLSISAWVLPDYDGRMAWSIGLSQHQYMSGPNAGWGQAASAGALRVQLVGEKWKMVGFNTTPGWVIPMIPAN